MVNGIVHYLRQIWKKPTRDMLKDRMIEWRASEAIVKVDKPLRLDRARALGYKAKKGVVVVRVRIGRGGRTRSRHTHGRRSRNQGIRKVLKMSYQWVAEIRAGNKYKNLEVLNSYALGKDGKHYFYEVILIDPERPEIKSDRVLSKIGTGANKKRAVRGITSEGIKGRGMATKSHNMKTRPSVRSWQRRGK